MTNQTPITYSMDGAMEALRISRATLYRLINSGDLRTYKIGKRRFCTHDAIIECQRAFEEQTIATH